MSALALLARELGYKVTGSDANCYPPVSDLLAVQGIEWTEGYNDSRQALKADCVIVGNAIKRGMPVIEDVLAARRPYNSGPQWLAENILCKYRVMAVAGTHGKTTTTSMLAYILHHAGLEPGFLIGGIASNFNTSASLGKGAWFIIEADEYDSAFFDKRPKFMHYRPEIAILNNLEFDHADIYTNLEAIQQQFQYFLRTIPNNGRVIKPRDDRALNQLFEQPCFCPVDQITLHGDASWRAELLMASGEEFRIWHQGKPVAEVRWPLIGQFNVENGLAAFAASTYAGVNPETAALALQRFVPVKRRLEVRAQHHEITIYDDFAHHPTAIGKTITALRHSARHKRVIVVLEFASYTMRTGVHADQMAMALQDVDHVYVLRPKDFDLMMLAKEWRCPYEILASSEAIVTAVINLVMPGDAVLVMSNRGFDNIHQLLIDAINRRFTLV